jgi:hypothetical protein
MSDPLTIDITEYRLLLARGLGTGETPQLRGFFGQAFAEEVMLHHHRADGGLVYDYPRIQFKVIDKTALLLGLAEGGELLTRLYLEVDHARIGREVIPVLESSLIRRRCLLGESPCPTEYRFLSPWIALNQENSRRYLALRSNRERMALLESILVGNCLSMSKSFGYQVESRLQADCSNLRPIKVSLKGVSMQAFLGTFQINFFIPDRAGIGKSVSRGFGTVERRTHDLRGGEI